jgi:hypothetical protein
MTDQEIEAVSLYYASRTPGTPPPLDKAP